MNKERKAAWLLASRENRKLLFKRKTDVILVFAFLIAMAIFGAVSSEVFVKQRNLFNIFTSNIGLLVVTYAQLIIICMGGIDLSVGSIISVVNVTLITLITDNPANWAMTFLICLVIGAVIGLINGLFVVKGNIQAIIATLATQTFFGGVALLIMDIPGGTMPSVLSRFLSKGWDYRFPLLFVIVFVAAIWFIINRTRFGRSILAIGGGEQAARATGIPVERVKLLAFAFSGVLSALAAICITAYTTSGNPLVGEVFTQRSITTAVVGGALLAGGKCSVVGCVAAVLIMGIINNLLNLLGITAYYQYVFQGLILLAALAVSAIRSRR